MEKIVMALQFIVALSIIVGLHELGHLLFAKLFGIKVESYSIGFPPKIFKFTWRGTEYSLGAILLGGSVKIAGMVDEYLDNSSYDKAPEPWEFRSKPAWQRLFVILGGILFNLFTGLIISIYIVYAIGESYLPVKEVNKYGILPSDLGRSIGFEEGDKILKLNGKEFEKFSELIDPYNLLKGNSSYTIERLGSEKVLNVPNSFLDKLISDKSEKLFITPLIPFIVGSVEKGSAAELIGLKKGDQIISIDGVPTLYLHTLFNALQGKANNNIELCYARDGVYNTVKVQLNEKGKLGFVPVSNLNYINHKYSLGTSVLKGVNRTYEIIVKNVNSLAKVITGRVSPSKSLSGPIGMAKLFGSSFNWMHFINMLGMISLVLAFTNLLPIPALDGGHALFIIYEIIFRRKISPKVMEMTQKAGMIILLMLIAYTLFNDIYKLF
jgi:regulator of sigma E protease